MKNFTLLLLLAIGLVSCDKEEAIEESQGVEALEEASPSSAKTQDDFSITPEGWSLTYSSRNNPVHHYESPAYSGYTLYYYSGKIPYFYATFRGKVIYLPYNIPQPFPDLGLVSNSRVYSNAYFLYTFPTAVEELVQWHFNNN